MFPAATAEFLARAEDYILYMEALPRLTVNLKESKNAQVIVREIACGTYNMRETSSIEEDLVANLLWYERAISASELATLRHENQRVNMIPGMHDMA